MRLQEFEIKSIKSAVKNIFGSDAKVTLFGSRVYDDVKGGDIDLYIEPINKENLFEKKIAFLVKLKSTIGDQKIDVWEWCLKGYEEPANTQASGSFWRVVRGGAWLDGLDFARASYRSNFSPASRDGNFGFRVCCVSPI